MQDLTQYIFEEVDIGIYKASVDGELIYCNPAFFKILGYASLEEFKLYVPNIKALYCSPQKRETIISTVLEKGKVVAIVRFRNKDNNCIICRLNMRYTGLDDTIFGFIENVTDSHQATLKLTKNLNSIVRAFSKTTEIRDSYTANHQKNVSQLSSIISNKLKLSRNEQVCLRYAALMHDIGKIHIPSEILNKSSKLSKLEMDMIKLHVTFGYEMLIILNSIVNHPYPILYINIMSD